MLAYFTLNAPYADITYEVAISFLPYLLYVRNGHFSGRLIFRVTKHVHKIWSGTKSGR